MDSRILEQIDVSLVGRNDFPDLDPDPSLSEKHTIRILMSLVATPFRKLKQVQLPEKFTRNKSHKVDGFLRRYTNLLECHDRKCAKCKGSCRKLTETRRDEAYMLRYGDYRTVEVCVQQAWFGSDGTQQMTCYVCRNHFCGDCHIGDHDGTYLDYDDRFLSTCDYCKKKYCGDCNSMYYCPVCQSSYCLECSDHEVCNGDGCTDRLCVECMRECGNCGIAGCESCVDHYACEGANCGKEHCEDCRSDHWNVERCSFCNSEFCAECLYKKCSKDWKNSCSTCKDMIASTMGEKLVKEIEALQDENQSLRKEIDALRKKAGPTDQPEK